jgi:NAD(P) transhydrogenase subunit alpha
MEEIGRLKTGAIHISLLDPFQNLELLNALAARGVTAVSLEMIPRITRAQSMDVLSSQANLAGYAAVVLAAGHLNKIFPLLMTAAGTFRPAKVFVIGAGVAGLQACATAHRLGAQVQAFDTRPVVEEEVRSVGARFLKIDLGQAGQDEQGYARSLTEEQLRKQREALRQVCADSDIVITAAQVFGRRAPVIVTRDMLSAMKPGAVVVDLAVENGGNVEGVMRDEVTDFNGVKVLGPGNMAGRVCAHASLAFSNNVTTLVEAFWDGTAGTMILPPDDEIIQGCLVTRDGRVCHPKLIPSAPGEGRK